MISTRAVGLGPALRRATIPQKLWSQPILRNCLQRRAVQTTSIPSSRTMEVLNQQRLRRPSSPHFTIYQPQLTWIGSIANRVTGVGIGVVLYGFSLAYLVAPGTFDSAHVIEFIHGVPDTVKYAGKAILALPFAYHSLNGVRHLAWDAGKFLSVRGAYATGYAVLGATAISTIAMVFYM